MVVILALVLLQFPIVARVYSVRTVKSVLLVQAVFRSLVSEEAEPCLT